MASSLLKDLRVWREAMIAQELQNVSPEEAKRFLDAPEAIGRCLNGLLKGQPEP